jgi:hypothetical protein
LVICFFSEEYKRTRSPLAEVVELAVVVRAGIALAVAAIGTVETIAWATSAEPVIVADLEMEQVVNQH